jgi:3-hydroxyisobutyrate dehydrogenase
MGAAIAWALHGRVSLAVYDVDQQRRQLVATKAGADVRSSVSELARSADVILLSLPDPAISRSVVDEMLPHLSRAAVVVETSTVTPSDIKALGSACDAAHVRFVEAAILSGVGQMENSAATLLVGGTDDALNAAAPVLELMARRQIRFDGLGSAMAAKVANNAVSHAVMVVLLEAAAMASGAGVPTKIFVELLMDPEAGLLRPLSHRLRERVLSSDYDGGMPTQAARKDSLLAMRLATETGVPLFAISASHIPYELAVAAGLAREDYAAIAKLWETWTGRSFGKALAPPVDGPK